LHHRVVQTIIRLWSWAEHVHSSSDRYAQQFDELKTRPGMDCGYSDY
jgi:hypothetical protein